MDSFTKVPEGIDSFLQLALDFIKLPRCHKTVKISMLSATSHVDTAKGIVLIHQHATGII